MPRVSGLHREARLCRRRPSYYRESKTWNRTWGINLWTPMNKPKISVLKSFWAWRWETVHIQIRRHWHTAGTVWCGLCFGWLVLKSFNHLWRAILNCMARHKWMQDTEKGMNFWPRAQHGLEATVSKVPYWPTVESIKHWLRVWRLVDQGIQLFPTPTRLACALFLDWLPMKNGVYNFKGWGSKQIRVYNTDRV